MHEFRIAPAGRFTAYGIAAVVITVGGFVTYVSVTGVTIDARPGRS